MYTISILHHILDCVEHSFIKGIINSQLRKENNERKLNDPAVEVGNQIQQLLYCTQNSVIVATDLRRICRTCWTPS
jgi:hypothetical protein